MKKPIKPGASNSSIRRHAEERLKERQNGSNSEIPHSEFLIPHSDTDNKKLIHELQVHQIELEMQNEELSLSRAEVEAVLERYADLYDFAPVGYFTLARDGTISQSNLTGACLIGVERARLVNRRFEMFVSEADRLNFNAFLERVFESKAEEVCDVALLKEDAGSLWAHIEALVSGDRQACRAAVMDITARKQVEEALRESEEKMRSIFRAAPTGIGMLVKRVFMEVNQRFCDMTGYPRDELIGRSARMIYPSDADYEYVGQEKYRQIAQTGTGAVETRFRRKDGTVIDVLLSSTPIDVADLSRGITFTVLDITDRRRVEEALRRSEERFRTLIERSADMIFIVDKKGTNTYVSPSVERILGYKPEDLTGKSCFHIILPVDVPRAIRDFGEAILSKDVAIPNVFRVRHKDGSERTLEGVGRSLFDHPAVAGFVMNVRDITERKKAEEAIREQMDELRRWHEATLGRETRVLDLKREVNELLAKIGQPPRYESAVTDGNKSDRNGECGAGNKE